MDFLNWLLQDNGGHLAFLAVLILAFGYGIGRIHGYGKGYSHGIPDASDDLTSQFHHNAPRGTRQRR